MPELVLIAGIVAVAYTVRGIAGFGSGLIAIPLLAMIRRLPENNIPDRAGFSFVIKARQQANSRTMERFSQHRGRTKRQAGWYVI